MPLPKGVIEVRGMSMRSKKFTTRDGAGGNDGEDRESEEGFHFG
jgi:hypothetical protein